jgi:hypothetical protein
MKRSVLSCLKNLVSCKIKKSVIFLFLLSQSLLINGQAKTNVDRLYDKEGKLLIINRVDWKGDLIEDSEGIAQINFVYNIANKIQEIRCNNINKQLVVRTTNSHNNKTPSLIRYFYKNNTFLTKIAFYDHNNNPYGYSPNNVMLSDVAYIIFKKVDTLENVIEKRYFDGNNKPCLKGEPLVMFEHDFYNKTLKKTKTLSYSIFDDTITLRIIKKYEYDSLGRLVKDKYCFPLFNITNHDTIWTQTFIRYNKINCLSYYEDPLFKRTFKYDSLKNLKSEFIDCSGFNKSRGKYREKEDTLTVIPKIVLNVENWRLKSDNISVSFNYDKPITFRIKINQAGKVIDLADITETNSIPSELIFYIYKRIREMEFI